MLLLPWGQLLLLPSSSRSCQDGSQCHLGTVWTKTNLSQMLGCWQQRQPKPVIHCWLFGRALPIALDEEQPRKTSAGCLASAAG